MRSFIVALSLAGLTASALAIQVVPISYSMPNGVAGAFTYFDDSYNGSGCVTCAGSALSGGKGDLTDGVLANANWFSSPGPWVGWSTNPTIVFQFAGNVAIDTVSLRFDDSNGNGGVSPPASVTIAGQTFLVTDAITSTPFDFTVTGLTFVGSSLPIAINRTGTNWVMLSEVTFSSTVPEAPQWAMLAAGALGLAGVVRRRREGHSSHGGVHQFRHGVA
jgi:MYXO-CTERM domain-containing protein